MSNTKQKLKEMAQLSLLANRISEVQEKNLKNFPFVFFESITLASISYDLGHGVNEETKQLNHNSHVIYDLELDESHNTQFLDKRFAALESSVRAVFWKDVKVKVLFNGKSVFESKDV